VWVNSASPQSVNPWRAGFVEGCFHFGGTESNAKSPSRCLASTFAVRKTENRSKRVPFGELFPVAEFKPTRGLTQDAESESSRRSAFFYPIFTGFSCGRPQTESSLLTPTAVSANRSRSPIWPKLSRSLFDGGRWVNNLVGFGPRKQRFAENYQADMRFSTVVPRCEVPHPWFARQGEPRPAQLFSIFLTHFI